MSSDKVHRLRCPRFDRMVGITRFRGTAHIEVGDLRLMIDKFNVPRDQIYRFVTVGGRRFVSVNVARRWSDVWRDVMDMAPQAKALDWILAWTEDALKEAERNDSCPAA